MVSTPDAQLDALQKELENCMKYFYAKRKMQLSLFEGWRDDLKKMRGDLQSVNKFIIQLHNRISILEK